LGELGSEHVMVIHSEDGLDEFSTAAPTAVAELHDGSVRQWRFDPAAAGRSGSLSGLAVENAAGSLALIRAALGGEPGPAADIIALNAGAALYVSGQADSFEDGIDQAIELLKGRRALDLLEAYSSWSQTA